jgi:hypothetical protein
MSHDILPPKYHCLLCDISFVNKKSSEYHVGSKRHITQQKKILSEKRKERKIIGSQIKEYKEQHRQLKAKVEQSITQFEELDLYIQKVKSYQID